MTYVTCGIYGIPQVTYVIRRKVRCVAQRPNRSGEVGHGKSRGNDGGGRLLKINNNNNNKGAYVRMDLTTACASTTPCLFVLIRFLLCRFPFLFCPVCSCLRGWR